MQLQEQQMKNFFESLARKYVWNKAFTGLHMIRLDSRVTPEDYNKIVEVLDILRKIKP